MPKSITTQCIEWNKQQFYRAIREERYDDAARYQQNVEKLEKLLPFESAVSHRESEERKDSDTSTKDKERKSTYGGL